MYCFQGNATCTEDPMQGPCQVKLGYSVQYRCKVPVDEHTLGQGFGSGWEGKHQRMGTILFLSLHHSKELS